MREGVGYSVTLHIVIIFVIIVFAFIIAALVYFKSNKVGNIITETIENHAGWSDDYEAEIAAKLSSIGYNRKTLACKASIGKCNLIKSVDDGYCIYLCYENPDLSAECNEYYYYKIRTNMFINVPIVNDIVEMPIYSETNRMYNFEYDESVCNGG